MRFFPFNPACKTERLCAAGGGRNKIYGRYKVTALCATSRHSHCRGVRACTHIRARERKRTRKDRTLAQGRPGLCLRWPGSSASIWGGSCALSPPPSPPPPLSSLPVSPSPPSSPQPLGHWQAWIGTDPPSFPQHGLKASLNRVAYAWVHTLHLPRKRVPCKDAVVSTATQLFLFCLACIVTDAIF